MMANANLAATSKPAAVVFSTSPTRHSFLWAHQVMGFSKKYSGGLAAPLLWLAPNAAGRGPNEAPLSSVRFVPYSGQKTTIEEVAQFMELNVGRMGYEVMNMWNVTERATAKLGEDGDQGFGLEVTLAQAIMVLNWLSMI
jgi:hypothetical protein